MYPIPFPSREGGGTAVALVALVLGRSSGAQKVGVWGTAKSEKALYNTGCTKPKLMEIWNPKLDNFYKEVYARAYPLAGGAKVQVTGNKLIRNK